MKHALLRLGPNTTLLSPYFSLPQVFSSVYLAHSFSVALACSVCFSPGRLLKSLFILETSRIPYHRCSVTSTNPSGCVFTPPLYSLSSSCILNISSIAAYTFAPCCVVFFRCLFDWPANIQPEYQTINCLFFP